MQGYVVQQGGLMRCCLQSLHEVMTKATVPPQEGDRVRCLYCTDEAGMIFVDGVWAWAAPKTGRG